MTWSHLAAGNWAYEKGLHDLGNGAWAWLQPDGGWGWSNAGLIVDGEASLLVDTLFDLPLTRTMLDAMRDAVPQARRIGQLVNTHANGDHCFGNQLVEGAEIIASATAAREMAEAPPERLAGLLKMARAQPESDLGGFLLDCFGAFEFDGITLTLPARTFNGHLALTVGNKQLELIEVGPAHTRGDTLVFLPAERLLFSGDILFVHGTPVVWAGPVQNWIDACDRILALDVATIVPGHGPITDHRGPLAVKAYLEFIRAESQIRYDAGLDAFEAARDIALADFDSWGDAERIAVNVDTVYRELSGATTRTEVTELFRRMAVIAGDRKRRRSPR